MPATIDYTPVLSLFSTARLSSLPTLFGLQTDLEKYGFCLWQQHAAASLYPLVQQLELMLRNAIDGAARARFGDYWWNVIRYDAEKDNAAVFRDNIRKAEKKLKRTWKKAQGLRPGAKVPTRLTAPPFAFPHDDIIAASDFHTWDSLLVDAYATDNKQDKTEYLWPLSLTKVFRRLDTIDRNPSEARRRLVGLINEIREYRNRLFHHDCLWIKSKSIDARTAIDSIREKINLLEKVMFSISPASVIALKKWGVFNHARRICSLQELAFYIQLEYPRVPPEDAAVFNRYLKPTQEGRASAIITIEGKTCALYRLR